MEYERNKTKTVPVATQSEPQALQTDEQTKEGNIRNVPAMSGRRRVLLTIATATTMLACNVTDLITGGAKSIQTESVPPTAQTFASPTLTPFQPSFAATETPFSVIDMPTVTPFIEPTVFIPTEALPSPAVAIDPFFASPEVYTIKSPTDVITSKEQAEGFLQALHARMVALGFVFDATNELITVKFKEPKQGRVGCETNAPRRIITCYDNDRMYLKADYSLLAHEYVHIFNEGATYNESELQAAVGAFIFSGRNPNIHDRYLFKTGFLLDGSTIYYSASDFVYGLEQYGITEYDLIKFSFNDAEAKSRVTQAAIAWFSSMGDFSGNSEFLIAASYNNGVGFLDKAANRDGINPYNNLLDPNTPIDGCRANQGTQYLLDNLFKTCVFVE